MRHNSQIFIEQNEQFLSKESLQAACSVCKLHATMYAHRYISLFSLAPISAQISIINAAHSFTTTASILQTNHLRMFAPAGSASVRILAVHQLMAGNEANGTELFDLYDARPNLSSERLAKDALVWAFADVALVEEDMPR